MKNEEKKAESKKKSSDDDNNYSADALDGYPSISSWETAHGRGFWGNATSGYLTDEQVNNMF